MKRVTFGSAVALLPFLAACGAQPEDAASQQSEFTVANGRLYYQGDILVDEHFEETPGQQPQSAGAFDRSKRYQGTGVNGVTFGAAWTGGIINWRFHSSVGAALQTTFRNAIAHYENNTTISFNEVASNFAGNYVLVRADDFSPQGCSSQVGMVGGAQRLDIGRTSDGTSTGFSTCSFGSMLHELGHAAGLIHEQSRADRNSFVTVGNSSDAVNCGIETNAASVSHYDFGSIMHYGPTACGGITPTDGSSFSANRTALGPMDIQGLQIMYGQEFDRAVSTVRRGSNTTDVFVHGEGNGFAWWNTKTNDTWSGFVSLGGPNNLPIVGNAEATSWSSSRLDVFARGRDGLLYRKSWNGTSWSPSQTGWTAVPGTGSLASGPSAIAWGTNRLDVFYRRPDLQVGHAFSSDGGSTWQTEIVGGNILGRPRVVSWGSGRLDVFVLGTDQRVYHKAFGGGAWSPSQTGWNDLGGNVVGNISAVTWGTDRLDIFVRGSDARLYHKAWAAGWSPSQTGWNDLGGSMNSNPEAATWGTNRLDIVYQDVDGTARWKRWTAAGWLPSQTTTTSLGGSLTGTPSITTFGTDRLDVFVRGTDNALWDNTMNNASSTWSGFTSRGGVLAW